LSNRNSYVTLVYNAMLHFAGLCLRLLAVYTAVYNAALTLN